MLTPKKKIAAKKELKQDALVTFYFRAIEVFDTYKKQIGMGLGVFVVAVALIVFYFVNRHNKNIEASAELTKIVTVYESGAYNEAINGNKQLKVLGLKGIVEKYGSTEVGENAKVYLANAYFYLGKFDEAMKYYDDFSGGNETFKAASIAGVASCLEAKDKYEDAAEKYEKAASISKNNVQNPDYLLRAGVDFMKVNKNDKAKELFAKIKSDYKQSFAIREVERYLTVLED